MSAAGGQVVSIYVAAQAGSPMERRDKVQAVPERGLEGDRYFNGDGAFSRVPTPGREVTELTLIEAEVIEHLRRDHSIELDAADSRRNIVTSGVALNELVGSEFHVGAVRLHGAGLCEPCVSLVKSHANSTSSAASPTRADYEPRSSAPASSRSETQSGQPQTGRRMGTSTTSASLLAKGRATTPDMGLVVLVIVGSTVWIRLLLRWW